MIHIRLHNYPDGRIELRLEGHAGLAPKGRDLVCAAMSILVYTAAEAVHRAFLNRNLQAPPVTVLQEGYAVVCARPKPQHRDAVRGIFITVRTGMEVLERNFPDYVRLSGNV